MVMRTTPAHTHPHQQPVVVSRICPILAEIDEVGLQDLPRLGGRRLSQRPRGAREDLLPNVGLQGLSGTLRGHGDALPPRKGQELDPRSDEICFGQFTQRPDLRAACWHPLRNGLHSCGAGPGPVVPELVLFARFHAS
jgi:hypothetical protein